METVTAATAVIRMIMITEAAIHTIMIMAVHHPGGVMITAARLHGIPTGKAIGEATGAIGIPVTVTGIPTGKIRS